MQDSLYGLPCGRLRIALRAAASNGEHQTASNGQQALNSIAGAVPRRRSSPADRRSIAMSELSLASSSGASQRGIDNVQLRRITYCSVLCIPRRLNGEPAGRTSCGERTLEKVRTVT